MEYKSSEIKAGLFIIVSVIILLGFLVVIVGSDTWTEKDTYRARFKYVGGIEEGSIVRYAGLEVGRVADMILPSGEDPRVELVLEVKKGTPIHQDSEAFLTTIGIMGSFYVEITAGSPDAPLLEPGSLIRSRDVTAFAQMSNSATELTEKLSELLTRINDLLNDDNREQISDMIAALNNTAQVTAVSMDKIYSNINDLTQQMADTMERVNTILSQNDSSITQSLVALQRMLEESQTLVTHLNQTLENMDYAITQNKADYSEILSNLSRVTRNLDEFSQTIKERPWNLVRKSHPPERKLD